jgi:hypothetical protein
LFFGGKHDDERRAIDFINNSTNARLAGASNLAFKVSQEEERAHGSEGVFIF